MIDAHIHVVEPNLPGDKAETPLLEGPPEPLATALKKEMREAGITQALAMGRWESPAVDRWDDPLGINRTLRLATLVPGLHPIGVADPTRTHPDHLRRVEVQLKQGKVRALKAYLGYLHFGPDYHGYAPYYELAAKFRLPFVFHTGDTFSPKAKVRFAHPLLVDEVAVDHPDVRFVLAHCGNPWLIDAAELIYKNENVWADLSALVIGGAADFKAEANQEALREVAQGVRAAMRFAEKPNRFLFGSDWPLVPMGPYRKFIESIVPEPHRKAVFEENAQDLFGLA
jgi:predicted TIM-barrel fold metal-dependent hydrolase